MNRKRLTAGPLLAVPRAAGIAGTAQAVNMNPDGLGQVLVYPYYTANDGNTTILSVVNTTDNAKAVKVRFLEGFNSREVLDFNLYLSHHDVWVAAIATNGAADEDYETDTILIIPDDSCTVPYLYEDAATEMPDGTMAGVQPFLNLAYTGDYADGGPSSNQRTSEGHFEMIEMGTIVPGSDTEDDITHQIHSVEDGDDYWAPGDCNQLVENWTGHTDPSKGGIWWQEAGSPNGQAHTDTMRNSGGLFGGAAVINPGHGAMFSYDARAIQGFDKSSDGIHFVPGTIFPSLNSGSETEAWVFFGVPQNKAVPLTYTFSVDAVSAVFMHEFTMNEYTTADIPAEAATEWVVTFPTKNFYVDETRLLGSDTDSRWEPIVDGTSPNPNGNGANDPTSGCGGWLPGDPYPTTIPLSDDPIDGPGPWNNPGWSECEYHEVYFAVDPSTARRPFTHLYGDEYCELLSLVTYDRSERSFYEERGGSLPPVVSPAPPYVCDPAIEFCAVVPFELCNEVNVLRFGERSIFGTPTIDDDSLLVSITLADNPDDQIDDADGWGWIDYYFDERHVDSRNMVGLPVTGFAAYQFENDFVESDDGTVKAFYGGLFQHKSNVRRK